MNASCCWRSCGIRAFRALRSRALRDFRRQRSLASPTGCWSRAFCWKASRRGPRAVPAARPAPLHLRPDARLAIGVEIGAREATAVLADLTGAVLAERVVPAQPETGPFLAAIHAVIRQLLNQGGERVLGVAVSIPGNLDPATGRVQQATNLAWRDLDVLGSLRGELSLPFTCENNSDLAAFAERWFRPADLEPLDHFVFVTLRVGLGTGLILNGQLVRGASNCAGEFGHTTLVPGGRPCVCGQLGCWEEYASDRALVRRYQEAGGPAVDSLEVVHRARWWR